MGAFFCILFCGMTKEDGGVWDRDPATLYLSVLDVDIKQSGEAYVALAENLKIRRPVNHQL